MPYPLPAPLTELRQFYTQYLDLLHHHPDRLSTESDQELRNQSSNDSHPDVDESSPLAAGDTQVDDTLPNADRPSGANTEQTNDKFAHLERLGLLEWWPVGGVQIGSPRYMAPEVGWPTRGLTI